MSFDPTELPHIAIEGSHGDSHFIEAVDFDFERVYRDLDGEVPIERDAADGVREFLNLVFLQKDGTVRKPKRALLQLMVITAGLRPDLRNTTYEEIGEKFGVTKAGISQIACGVQDALGFKFSRSRPLASREKMAAARRRAVQGGARTSWPGQGRKRTLANWD